MTITEKYLHLLNTRGYRRSVLNSDTLLKRVGSDLAVIRSPYSHVVYMDEYGREKHRSQIDWSK